MNASTLKWAAAAAVAISLAFGMAAGARGLLESHDAGIRRATVAEAAAAYDARAAEVQRAYDAKTAKAEAALAATTQQAEDAWTALSEATKETAPDVVAPAPAPVAEHVAPAPALPVSVPPSKRPKLHRAPAGGVHPRKPVAVPLPPVADDFGALWTRSDRLLERSSSVPDADAGH